MAADPKPGNGVALEDTKSAISRRDSYRPDIFSPIDAFEMQGRMKRIF
jgi:hypothetical protein